MLQCVTEFALQRKTTANKYSYTKKPSEDYPEKKTSFKIKFFSWTFFFIFSFLKRNNSKNSNFWKIIVKKEKFRRKKDNYPTGLVTSQHVMRQRGLQVIRTVQLLRHVDRTGQVRHRVLMIPQSMQHNLKEQRVCIIFLFPSFTPRIVRLIDWLVLEVSDFFVRLIDWLIDWLIDEFQYCFLRLIHFYTFVEFIQEKENKADHLRRWRGPNGRGSRAAPWRDSAGKRDSVPGRHSEGPAAAARYGTTSQPGQNKISKWH